DMPSRKALPMRMKAACIRTPQLRAKCGVGSAARSSDEQTGSPQETNEAPGCRLDRSGALRSGRHFAAIHHGPGFLPVEACCRKCAHTSAFVSNGGGASELAVRKAAQYAGDP